MYVRFFIYVFFKLQVTLFGNCCYVVVLFPTKSVLLFYCTFGSFMLATYDMCTMKILPQQILKIMIKANS